jgi:hypothetical protein
MAEGVEEASGARVGNASRSIEGRLERGCKDAVRTQKSERGRKICRKLTGWKK